MKNVENFFDDRNKAWCVHCTASLVDAETNRDHVPSKCLLPRPLPENTPVIEVCKRCNSSFSQDEEYLAAVLAVVMSGSLDPDELRFPSWAKMIKQNARLRRELELATTPRQPDLFGPSPQFTLYPDADRIRRVVLKNARGHAFFEYGEPMMATPSSYLVTPLENLTPDRRAHFESANGVGHFEVWPEVGSRMMTRAVTGIDLVDGWVVVAPGWYRYVVDQIGGLRVRTVLQEYLATEVVW